MGGHAAARLLGSARLVAGKISRVTLAGAVVPHCNECSTETPGVTAVTNRYAAASACTSVKVPLEPSRTRQTR